MANKRKEISLPIPECNLGYTYEQVQGMFGTVGYQMLMRFMEGQTMAICACMVYDPEKRTYVDSGCRHKSSTIYYPSDIRRFVERLPVID